MPEDGGDVDGGAFGRAQPQPQRLYIDVNQRRYATHQVEGMRGSKHVKERTARISGYVDAGFFQLVPGNGLSRQEEDSERGGDGPPQIKPTAIAGSQGASRLIQNHA